MVAVAAPPDTRAFPHLLVGGWPVRDCLNPARIETSSRGGWHPEGVFNDVETFLSPEAAAKFRLARRPGRPERRVVLARLPMVGAFRHLLAHLSEGTSDDTAVGGMPSVVGAVILSHVRDQRYASGHLPSCSLAWDATACSAGVGRPDRRLRHRLRHRPRWNRALACQGDR